MGFAAQSLDQDQAHKFKGLLRGGWRAGLFVGIGALLLRVILRSVAAGVQASSDWSPFSSAADRAALIALVAGFLTASADLRNPVRPKPGSDQWAGLLPLAIVAAISVRNWPAKSSPAPLLMGCTLIVAGIGLWATGQGLNALTKNCEANRWVPVLPPRRDNCEPPGRGRCQLAGLGDAWRYSRRVAGQFLGPLCSLADQHSGPYLGQSSVRLARALHFLAAALLVGIAQVFSGHCLSVERL